MGWAAFACGLDAAEHPLFRYQNWDGLRIEFCKRLHHLPIVEDMSDILCGSIFEDFPDCSWKRGFVLKKAEEILSIFYKMAEEILTLKDSEERAGQTAEAAED